MAKKNEENENAPEEKPVAKKPKPKKGVDQNQLDLFFTAYTPPAKDSEGNDAHQKGKGIDQLVPEAKPKKESAAPKADSVETSTTETNFADAETDDEVYEVKERKPKKPVEKPVEGKKQGKGKK